MKNDLSLGYIKYEGEQLREGYLDARIQAKALLSVDSAIRDLLIKSVPELQQSDFELPVRVQKGSWETVIPETIQGWIAAGGGLVVTTYLATAAKKMAENDFEEIGFKNLLKKSLNGVVWFIKLSKHLRNTQQKKFEKLKFSDRNSLVHVPNQEGKYLAVPKEMFDLFVVADPKLLSGLAELVTSNRHLVVGVNENGETLRETVDLEDKKIFFVEDDEELEDFLFPELKHGDRVVLDGEVTRENKISNSMGFKYKGHILTAHPSSGSITAYKDSLFLYCRLHAIVSRDDGKSLTPSRRPKLYFDVIEPLNASGQADFFK